MGALLSAAGMVILLFLLPALYTFMVILLEGIFGKSFYIYIAVSAVFVFVILRNIYLFIKYRLRREDMTDETDYENNNW